MDEFWQLNQSKLVGHGFYTNFWPAKAIGYALFYQPARWLASSATSMLLVGRLETALLACGTLAIVYATARSLGQSRMRSALILLVLLSFSNFIERIFETRAEPLATFFGAAALLVAVRASDRSLRIAAAGVLSGLAFLATQKAIYFNVALGLALVGDAALSRRFALGFERGSWLVLGWLLPVIAYCLVFGGTDPLPVAQNLVFGPVGVASPQTAAEYGGLRQFVVQTLVRNLLLYLICFAGMVLALLRLRRIEGALRIALIFTWIVTALVFAHNQPWPYVFVMALPFMALWAMGPFDALASKWAFSTAAWGVFAVAILASFVTNAQHLRRDNRDQLALVRQAEKLVSPNELYFDGIGMLPNRYEPNYRWLDVHNVKETLREGQASWPYQAFANTPPKLIIWSYRMDAIEPVIGPLVRDSYVQIAPNIRIAGIRLRSGEAATFVVPVAGSYELYDLEGRPVEAAEVRVDGAPAQMPLSLSKGRVSISYSGGTAEALLLPKGNYAGLVRPGEDNKMLFSGVYS